MPVFRWVWRTLTLSPDESEEAVKFRRKRGFEVQWLAGAWVNKAEYSGMECQSFFTPWNLCQQFRSVAGFSEHRVSGFGEVHADLIPSAGFESDLKSGDGGAASGIGEAGEEFPVGDGNFALSRISCGVATEIFSGGEVAADGPGGFREVPGDKGFVATVGGVFGELVLQVFSGGG